MRIKNNVDEAERAKTFSLVALLVKKGILSVSEVKGYEDIASVVQILLAKGVIDREAMDKMIEKDREFFPRILKAISVYASEPGLFLNLERKYESVYPEIFKFFRTVFGDKGKGS